MSSSPRRGRISKRKFSYSMSGLNRDSASVRYEQDFSHWWSYRRGAFVQLWFSNCLRPLPNCLLEPPGSQLFNQLRANYLLSPPRGFVLLLPPPHKSSSFHHGSNTP